MVIIGCRLKLFLLLGLAALVSRVVREGASECNCIVPHGWKFHWF